MKKFFKVVGIILGILIGIYIILDITFSIQLHNKINELKAQGRPTTIAEIIPPAVPDKENAAILYNKSFALMKSKETNEMVNTIEWAKSFSDISQWTDEQRKQIPELVNSKEMQDVYKLLEEGSKKPECNFNPDYENMILPEYLPNMRRSMRLLCVKALLEAEAGNTGNAFDTLLIGLKMSNHLKDEPTMISQLVRIACDGMIIDSIESIADSKDSPVENVVLIVNELPTHGDIPFIKCMDAGRINSLEKVLQNKISFREILELRYMSHVSQEQYYRDMSLHKHWYLATGKNTLGIKLLSSLTTFLYKPILKKDEICNITLITYMQDSYHLPYYEFVQQIKAIEKQIPKYYILTRYRLPSLKREQDGIARHQANIEICKTGLALKIYKAKNGTYPEKLESLVPDLLSGIPIDPFSGKSLIYKKSGDDFILYSIGSNMKDDGGISPRTAGWRGDWDIVWGCWDCEK